MSEAMQEYPDRMLAIEAEGAEPREKVDADMPVHPSWWKDAPEVGLYQNIPYDDYDRWAAMRHSVLRMFSKTPAHAREKMIHPDDQTEAQSQGHSTHAAILEPDRFDLQFVAAPRVDKRTTKGKAEWAEFVAAATGKTVIPAEEHALCIRLRDAVWSHPTAAELLRGPGMNEVSAVWKDADSGVPCKGRIDRLTTVGGWSMVVDLKTTKSAMRQSFSKDLYFYQYHQQAAMYLDGCDALAPHPRKYVFIAVEKEPPYLVATLELEQDAIDLGRDEYKKHLATYAQCLQSGRWPGYDDGIGYVSLPHWAFRFHGEEG